MPNSNKKQPVKLTQGYIKNLIRHELKIVLENSDKLENIIRSTVNQVLVEHGVVKPKKKTREDVLLEKLNELKKLEAQVLSELGVKQSPINLNEQYNNNEIYSDESEKEEINRIIEEMESRLENLSEEEKINLQVLKETKGSTHNSSINHYANAVDRVNPELAERYRIQDPRSIAQSAYNTIPQNVSMVADPETAMQYYENKANVGEFQKVDPAQRLQNHLKNMKIKEEDLVIGPVFEEPKDLER